MKHLIHDVDEDMNETTDKLNSSLILPFSKDYEFCSNGVYFYCGKMGSGKTFNLIRHILITERLGQDSYYDQIIISATSDSMDSTAKTFMSKVQASVVKVPDSELMNFFNVTFDVRGNIMPSLNLYSQECKRLQKRWKELLTNTTYVNTQEFTI
ncbi:hypothetical protein TVAGG3_0944440 [Trichomonas vaginalis G3]|uniref:hypothetical protein n=1 Tax=Trichomonas vaginalis (strain ATCC PRA-98 / G3) TaxID=412133 RepID=UPI0021E613BE|nr:hypothetical protein TVAGG3_0944440 [Trichomonas vaginalis G3]KAI5486771.1 hypothetical protein TVAGG3_0944440 [Trichomonas vaginalis G3]